MFALRPQTVGQQREIQPAVRLSGLADSRELVLVDRPRVIKQSPDQRRLAIVNAAGGGETEESEVALAFLELHGAFLVVIDHAVLALRAAEFAHFGDDLRHCVGI